MNFPLLLEDVLKGRGSCKKAHKAEAEIANISTTRTRMTKAYQAQRNVCLAGDYQRLPETSQAFIYIDITRIMVR
ncbi:MAG: hypothetical protein AB1861_00605 [Cyanobacteriota bacterium]